MSERTGFLDTATGWVRGLPPALLVAVALVGAAVVAGGGYYAYQTYDYIEHDNEFCISCHLMVEPYEAFAQSAHRGLGCKACHQPTFVARSQMALTQILEQPVDLETHAEVPNEQCASCHIEGDPQTWEIIENSAGHRVHLESEDSTLQGLMCVECHSTTIHEFAPSTRTCSQSGCHEDTGIRLGQMADLTIHCSACHGFVEPVSRGTGILAAEAALQPDMSGCLSCHAMRELIDLPEDEPHDGVCAACHNPHTQVEAGEATGSCATVGCHDRPDTLTAFHRGLDPGTLEDCTNCHTAHTFRLEGGECTACHQGIMEGEGTVVLPGGRTALSNPHAGPPPVGAGDGERPRAVRLALHTGGSGPSDEESHPLPAGHPTLGGKDSPREAAAALRPQPVQQQITSQGTRFRHTEHRGIECTDCHATDGRTHGQVTLSSLAECRQCHHTRPVAADCSRCHQESDVRGRTYELTRTPRLSVGTPTARTLPFDHAEHRGLDCASCHTEGPGLSATSVSCADCHEDHHQPTTACRSCHLPRQGEHTVEAHVGCAGAGCHDPVPPALRDVPRTRPFCLACHQELVDHRPGRNCVQCHALPSPERRQEQGDEPA